MTAEEEAFLAEQMGENPDKGDKTATGDDNGEVLPEFEKDFEEFINNQSDKWREKKMKLTNESAQLKKKSLKSQWRQTRCASMSLENEVAFGIYVKCENVLSD